MYGLKQTKGDKDSHQYFNRESLIKEYKVNLTKWLNDVTETMVKIYKAKFK